MIRSPDRPHRLAVVVSHPTQYYSPWFRYLASRPDLDLKVFYLWDFGVTEHRDRTFGTTFSWDIPLLDGYGHEFIVNRSRDPGTHHFLGLDNPAAVNLIRRWQPDALLLFGYNYATHLRLLLSPRLRRIAFLFRGDSHDLYRPASWKHGVGRLARNVLFRRFSGLLAVGGANHRYFRHNGVPDAKVTHVPHCVDNERFLVAAAGARQAAVDWKRMLGIPEGGVVILFAGKFENKKRPLDLLRAFLDIEQPSEDAEAEAKMEIRGQRSEIRMHGDSSDLLTPASHLPSSTSHLSTSVLLFVGNGPLEADLKAAAGRQLGRTVFFAPFQNQTEMPKVYASGDVLVLPSFGGGETWGLAINEAMNLSRPVIVSDHVGCAEDLVLDGRTGWTFPAGDVAALRERLQQVVAQPEKLGEMGDLARQHVARFSYERAGDALIEVLKKLRSNSTGSGSSSEVA